ncbi:SGNH/GDSL hydrolase family protein [Rhodococcus pyridinivorans]|uniref:SGNH/GDSL hydrolase family protein n=1 Tax=Rhodococcus pyridinivorans TaxID=103816 RepID=UPI003D7F97F9
MSLYDAQGAARRVYDAAGNPVTWYDAQGRIVSGGGEPVPSVNYARNEHPNHLAQWWNTLATADSSRVSMMWATNSLYGYYANDAATVNYPVFNTLGHIGRDRTAVAERFGDRGEGVIPFNDWRWTTTGTTTSDTYGFSMRGTVIGPGVAATLAGVQFTKVRIARPVRTLPDVAPTYQVDGGAAVTGATGTAVGQIIRDEITAPDGTHTLTINGPASGSVTIASVAVLHDGPGVVIHRNSSPGGYVYNFLEAKSGDSSGTQRRLTYTLDEYDVDLLVLAFGHNEWRSGQALGTPITPTKFYNDTMFILDHQCGVRGKNAVLPIGPGASVIGSPAYPEEAFWDVYRQIAADNERVDCFDYRPIIGPFTEAGAGTWVDGVHQNAEGHRLMHLVDMASLLPEGAALTQRIVDAA